MASRNDLRIGTSGWSYPTGEGTWNGIFYPAGKAKTALGKTGKSGKFDELAYYAERFDTVEINSTFYRTPAPQCHEELGRAHAERTSSSRSSCIRSSRTRRCSRRRR